MTKPEMLAEMKQLHEALNKLKTDDKEQRDILQTRFDYLDMEFNGGVDMEAYQIRGKLDELISDIEEMDEKDPKLAALLTTYNDNVRKLFEREQAEKRRGDVAPDYEVRMKPLYSGDLDGLLKAYRANDKKPVYTAPIYATARTSKPGEYRSVFGKEPSRGAFADSGDFFRSIMSGQFDARLEHRMVASTGSLGGIVVPEYLVAEVMDKALESEIIRSRATVYPMNTLKITIPGFQSYSHTSNATVGGFTPVWGAEASTQTAQDATMEAQEMEMKYLQLFCNASVQLLSSASGFESVLQKAMSDSISFSLDSAYISGSGVGQPKGITKDAARIAVTRTSAGTILYSDLCAMYARMYSPNLKSAVWIANASTLPSLMQLIAAGSSVPYVVQDPASGAFRMMGKEILFTEKLPALGSENDLMLCDLSQYNIGLNPLLLFDKSNAVEWYKSMVSFRIVIGTDGQGSWTSPVTPANGSTQSWCIGLI